MRTMIVGGAALLAMLWTGFAWAVHALVVWAGSQAGAWSGAATDAVARLPEALARWVPADVMAAVTLGLDLSRPALDWLGQHAPLLGHVWTVLVLMVWALGALLIAGAGWGAHRWAVRSIRPSVA